MKIASAALQLDSTHYKLQKHELRESLRTWLGKSRPDTEKNTPATERVRISEAGRAAQSNETEAADKFKDALRNDPRMRLIMDMIALLTGKEAIVFDASELNTASPTEPNAPDRPANSATPGAAATEQSSGFAIEYERHESYSENEQTTFSAHGLVNTADGKQISFSLSLEMTRNYYEESNLSLRLGDAIVKKDPLVLNFNGSAAQLGNQRFRFDLNADGQAESINFVTSGSGFLALDRNADGSINDGSELFGAKTGDGFAELTVLDQDNNGWIDENDGAFSQLRVWTKDSAGNDQFKTLKQANVGALSLSRVSTPFDLKDSNNALLGQIRSSGVFLQDDGKAGTVQQIDLTV
jgi:hypothetical protein